MRLIIPNVEELIPDNHRYRKLHKLLDWKELARPLRSLYVAPGEIPRVREDSTASTDAGDGVESQTASYYPYRANTAILIPSRRGEPSAR